MGECPWCHGTDTQFCNNPECRPTQSQPAQYREHQGNACLGIFVALGIDIIAGVLCVAGVALYKLFA